MNEGPNPDLKALTILKAFALCDSFGWNLSDLGIPPEEQTLFTEGFLIVLGERNKTAERENRLREMRNKWQ